MLFKRFWLFSLCLALVCFCLVSCGSYKIPELTNVAEADAKDLLATNGLIPAVVYEHSDEVAEGCLIRTEPAIGTSVAKNSVVTIYVSNGPALKVPDIVDVDEETAKKVLTSNQLIPSITYEYSDTIIEGNVTRTEPEIGSVVETNAKITVYLSYGPAYVEAKHVTVERISTDGMDGCKVYRNGDKLYIECIDFYCSWAEQSSWYDPDNTGYLQGIVSLTDDFYKSVPTRGKYEHLTWYYDGRLRTPQSFTLEISLLDLGIDKPSLIHIQLYYTEPTYNMYGKITGASNEVAHFNLTITW